MTPIEVMCRAMRDSEPGMEEKHWRYWLPSARAALLALAEYELPAEIISVAEHHFDKCECAMDAISEAVKSSSAL